MTNSVKNKKVLILGGASVHLKLIEASKQLGAYTIVTDNVPYENSPGKKIADEYWDVDIYEIDKIVERCKKIKIDGVISGWLDPCQIPYLKICEKLNLPCYGTREQFCAMTDKILFKQICKKCGVGVIDDFTFDDIEKKHITFPVFVKPKDSRGSRGQSVCYSYEDLKAAIDYAKSESSNGDVIIEKYISNPNEIQITYFFIDGTPYLIRTTDSYNGKEEYNLEKVVACSVSPSRFTDIYLEEEHKSVLKMFSEIGVKNGPIFMQGFFQDGRFMFFDPGRRFPGVDYDLIYRGLYNVDFMKMMIHFSVFGSFGCSTIPERMVYLDGKRAAVLFPTISSGTIQQIKGISFIGKNYGVFSFSQRYSIGDKVNWCFNVNQRFGEFDFVSDCTESLKNNINLVLKHLDVIDNNGNSMIYAPFETERII